MTEWSKSTGYLSIFCQKMSPHLHLCILLASLVFAHYESKSAEINVPIWQDYCRRQATVLSTDRVLLSPNSCWRGTVQAALRAASPTWRWNSQWRSTVTSKPSLERRGGGRGGEAEEEGRWKKRGGGVQTCDRAKEKLRVMIHWATFWTMLG